MVGADVFIYSSVDPVDGRPRPYLHCVLESVDPLFVLRAEEGALDVAGDPNGFVDCHCGGCAKADDSERLTWALCCAGGWFTIRRSGTLMFGTSSNPPPAWPALLALTYLFHRGSG